jgi:hypothetical protein
MTKKLLGYQLADSTGKNIQGSDTDPTSNASFEVMAPHVATTVMRQLSGGFLLMPIYEGDIEDPTIIEA